MALSKTKLVLTTGETTTNLEDYVLDLFNLYMSIYPGDIPHAPNMGFDFNLAGVMKDELAHEVRSRLEKLITKLQDKIPSGVTLEAHSIDLIDEERVKLTLKLDGHVTDEILIDLYNKN